MVSALAAPCRPIGKVAIHFGVPAWQVRRVITRGLVREPARVGAYRVFVDEDLPKIEAALKQAGYLRDEGVAED
jgi:DNA-binding transcriptional MerR regulator